jgi:hypothetical protein
MRYAALPRDVFEDIKRAHAHPPHPPYREVRNRVLCAINDLEGVPNPPRRAKGGSLTVATPWALPALRAGPSHGYQAPLGRFPRFSRIDSEFALSDRLRNSTKFFTRARISTMR